MLDMAIANLLAPPILFFVLGAVAALGRSDLTIPEAAAKTLSIYLLLAIGFKGGVAARAEGITLDFALMTAAGIILSAALPLLVFPVFAKLARLDRPTAAATAAHYGSISIVTFVTALDFAERAGVAVSGHMVAVAAAMESPAILTGLVLAALATRDAAHAGAAGTGAPPARLKLPPHLMREVFFNGSVVVLVGAFAVGVLTGDAGMKRLDLFVNGIFQGVLCLFLLDMGLLAARRLMRGEGDLPRLALAAAVATMVCAALGAVTGKVIGASEGDLAMLIVLTASASYIAVPAAMRVALPEANPGAYLSASLGVTFPLNLTIGIPTYFAVAGLLG
jgi:uncharacterized protein